MDISEGNAGVRPSGSKAAPLPQVFTWVALYRCERCFALFCVVDQNAKYGAVREVDLVEANPCSACGKGSVEWIGDMHLGVGF